jgi:hypothetical protein
VTGNVSGTAATVTSAAQTAITSVGTLTNLTVTNAINGTLTKTVTGTSGADLIYGNMADSDQFRIRIGGTATNAGYVEIATSDDGTEPIYVRQYTQVGGVAFTTLNRTATLLDGSGNTSFPGTVTAPTFIGALTGTASGNLVSGGALGTPSSGTLTNCTFPTLNQSTTGSAATLTNTRTLWGQNFNGSANVSGALTGATTIALSGATSGITTLQASAAAGTTTITLPNTTGTVALTTNVRDAEMRFIMEVM